MARRLMTRTRSRAMLAGIARREWLLQMLALAAAGCRRSDDPAYSRGNTLVMAIRDVDEVRYDDYDIQSLYLPRLAALDENGDLEPLLAQSWEQSADNAESTYHLRTGVRWSDGVPVTAHDVKFTLDLLNHPAVHYAVVDAVTVLDDYTVKIRRRAGAGPASMGWVYHLPKHVLEDLEPTDFWEWDYWRHPAVSAGPYRFVRYVPETMMEFEANPIYYRGTPKIERLVYKFVGRAGLNELLSGNVDIVTWPIADPAQVPRVVQDPRFHVHQAAGPGAMAIYWNCNHALFGDARIRRALTLAMDRRVLLGVLNLPSDLHITDGVLTERQFRRRQFPEPAPYDPAQACAHLEAAGWQDRDGGWRARARWTAVSVYGHCARHRGIRQAGRHRSGAATASGCANGSPGPRFRPRAGPAECGRF